MEEEIGKLLEQIVGAGGRGSLLKSLVEAVKSAEKMEKETVTMILSTLLFVLEKENKGHFSIIIGKELAVDALEALFEKEPEFEREQVVYLVKVMVEVDRAAGTAQGAVRDSGLERFGNKLREFMRMAGKKWPGVMEQVGQARALEIGAGRTVAGEAPRLRR